MVSLMALSYAISDIRRSMRRHRSGQARIRPPTSGGAGDLLDNDAPRWHDRQLATGGQSRAGRSLKVTVAEHRGHLMRDAARNDLKGIVA